MEPFAYFSDLEDRWRPLTESERDLADTLLADASMMIRERWPDVDARLASGALMPDSLVRIVCGIVKRAMLAPDDDALESRSVTTGPFGETRNYANPNGNLYLNASDIALLDGYNRPTAKIGWLA